MNRVGMPPVVARNHESSAITGIVRSEMITPAPAASPPIILIQQIQNYPPDSYDSYPTASLDNSVPLCPLRGGGARAPQRVSPSRPRFAWSPAFKTCVASNGSPASIGTLIEPSD